jgi:hypothetical protein
MITADEVFWGKTKQKILPLSDFHQALIPSKALSL